jgi:hypothetical protein
LRRLKDESWSLDSPEHRLVELVRAMPALERTPFAMDRIFARVTSVATLRRRSPWIACAIALGIGVSAVAAAAVAHFEVAVVPPASPARPAGPLTESTPPPAAVASIPNVGGATPEVLSYKADLGVVPHGSPSILSPQASPSPKPKLRTRSTESLPLSGGEDPAPLLEAIRALRSNGDSVRAGVLLADYLKAFPNSALSEDALALSIEAAVARHDRRSAAELVRRYVGQFPAGRYRTFVSRVAQSNPSTDAPP